MSKNLKWFTIFWLSGEKSFVCGETIEDACNHAGIGNGALRAVDWYDEGIVNSHWRDKTKKEWVKYLEAEYSASDFVLLSLDDLLNLMETHNGITVKWDNQDIVLFKRDWGLFYLNGQSCWVEYLQISFGEYFKGTYGGDSDDEENQHHYMMANSQYFAPDNLSHALECLMRRVKTEPFRTCDSEYCEQLEAIHAKQKVSYNT